MRNFIRLGVPALFALACVGCGDDDGSVEADSGMPVPADTTAPAMVADLSATATEEGAPSVELSWTNPSDSDLAGILVVRSTTSLDSLTPADGTTYALSDALGDGTVVATADQEQLTDTDVTAGITYNYALFAFDAAANYSPIATTQAEPGLFSEGRVTVAMDGSTGAVALEDGSAGAPFTVTTTSPASGTVEVALTFTNTTDKVMFNPKIVIENISDAAVYSDPYGLYEGNPYAYFGPAGLAPGATSPTVILTFTNVTADFTFDSALASHAMAIFSHSYPQAIDQMASLIDTGVHRNVATMTLLALEGVFAEEGVGPRFNAISRDSRYAFFSAWGDGTDTVSYAADISVVDLTTLAEVASIDVLPGAGQITFGMEVSADGDTLYASYHDGIALNLRAIDISDPRAPLIGDAALLATDRPSRSFAINHATNQAFVPSYGGNTLHVVDLATMTETDTDGDAANGATPISLGETLDSVALNSATAVALSPDNQRIYVTFGGETGDSAVASIALSDLNTIDLLPVTSDTGGSSPNVTWTPDGRLVVSRIGYERTPPYDAVSIYDLSADPVTETSVDTVENDGNNDMWGVGLIPNTTLMYAAMADEGRVMVFDSATGLAIDVDAETDGHQHIQLESDLYGGDLIMTH